MTPSRTGAGPDRDVPLCVDCGTEQPFLLSLNEQVEVVNFICEECGHQQTRIVGEDTEEKYNQWHR